MINPNRDLDQGANEIVEKLTFNSNIHSDKLELRHYAEIGLLFEQWYENKYQKKFQFTPEKVIANEWDVFF